MGLIVKLALTFGIAAITLMFMGSTWGIVPFSCLAILLGIIGFFKPMDEDEQEDKEPRYQKRKNNALLTAGFSIILAILPVFKPFIDAMIQEQFEKRQAEKMAPLYKEFDQAAQAIEPSVVSFYQEYGAYPGVDETGTIMPFIAADGNLMEIPPNALNAWKDDPFNDQRKLTLFPLGNRGALIVSVGQDGVSEMPPLKLILPIDAQPNDPMAPLITAGLDFRTRLYDPTNGSLSNGDLMKFVSARDDLKRDDVLKPIFDAWNDVDALSRKPPRNLSEGEAWPPPEDDAELAEDFLKDENYLPALAAASRAVLQRRPHPNFWSTNQLKLAEFYKGRALYELGHYRSASDAFLNYTTNFPNDVEGQYWVGLTKWMGGDREQAKRHMAAAFQIDPTHPRTKDAELAFQNLEARKQLTYPMPYILRPVEKSDEIEEMTPPE